MIGWRYVRPKYATPDLTAEDEEIFEGSWTSWTHAGVLRSCWLNSRLLTSASFTAASRIWLRNAGLSFDGFLVNLQDPTSKLAVSYNLECALSCSSDNALGSYTNCTISFNAGCIHCRMQYCMTEQDAN